MRRLVIRSYSNTQEICCILPHKNHVVGSTNIMSKSGRETRWERNTRSRWTKYCSSLLGYFMCSFRPFFSFPTQTKAATGNFKKHNRKNKWKLYLFIDSQNKGINLEKVAHGGYKLNQDARIMMVMRIMHLKFSFCLGWWISDELHFWSLGGIILHNVAISGYVITGLTRLSGPQSI